MLSTLKAVNDAGASKIKKGREKTAAANIKVLQEKKRKSSSSLPFQCRLLPLILLGLGVVFALSLHVLIIFVPKGGFSAIPADHLTS